MQQNGIKILLVIGIMLGCISCNPFAGGSKDGSSGKQNQERLNPADYVQWMQDKDNGIKKEKVIDDITFSIQYKPYEYIVCLEEKKQELSDSVVKKKKEEISDMQYFDLTIALTTDEGELLKHNVSSYDQYDKRIKYASFDMQKDIKLVEDGDTIPCSLYHFERTYDVAPYANFLLGFAKGKKAAPAEKVITFYDNLFNKGLIKFTYTNEEFNTIPKLKTNDEL